MNNKVTIQVEKEKKLGALERSWRYIGYDECNYTYIPEGVELLNKFSNLEEEPYYVRTHFMFCTGNCHGTYKFGSTNLYREDELGNPIYDFTHYDMVVDAILNSNNKPLLELGFMPMDLVDMNYMISPQGIWDRYFKYKDNGWNCPPKDYSKWYDLIVKVAEHLVERYGAEEVKTWYFELWNEPDANIYWKSTAAEYCKLYDYTEHALHKVIPEAYLSGPSVTGIFEGGDAQKFMRFFLNHCKNGNNFYTQEKGTRLDYITFHVKGGGFPFDLDASKAVPSVSSLVHQVKLGLDIIKDYGYEDREVVLTEADPDGWAAGGMYDNANMIFRNTEYYASFVAASYHQIEKLSEKYGIKIRPLAWAFFFPGERCFEGTRTFSTQGINKAVFNIFKIFGKLGHTKLASESDGANERDFVKEPVIGKAVNISEITGDSEKLDVGTYAVEGKNGETQIVIYSHHDDRDIDEMTEVTVKINGYADKKDLKVTHYRIDKEHSNAYAEWLRQGKPLYPQGKQYEAIKAKDGLEELCPTFTLDSNNNIVEISFSMPTHGVSFLQVE